MCCASVSETVAAVTKPAMTSRAKYVSPIFMKISSLIVVEPSPGKAVIVGGRARRSGFLARRIRPVNIIARFAAQNPEVNQSPNQDGADSERYDQRTAMP